MSDAYERVVWKSRTLNKRTAAMLEEVERRLKHELIVFQGSYNSGGVSASAGTHDGGGAVDVWCTGVEPLRVQRVMRAVGFAAWYRPAIPDLWGNHVHAIAIADREMSLGARAQVVDYFAHRDGLKSHAHDDTWHPDPIPTFDYERAIDVQLDDKLANGKTVGDALVAVLKMQEALARFRAATHERDVALRQQVRALARNGAVQLDELEELLSKTLSEPIEKGSK